MEYKDYIKQGLNGNAPLKLILCGNIQGTENDKVGVVSVVYATNDKDLAEQKMNELIAVNPNNYYMVYSVPLNVDLPFFNVFQGILETIISAFTWRGFPVFFALLSTIFTIHFFIIIHQVLTSVPILQQF